MKNLLWLFHLTWLFALPVHATIVLDDTFADGNRTNQNLPTDAAWFVSSSTAWKTSASALTVTNGTSAILGVTCFAANPTNPISLNVGDTLTVGVTFTFNNLAPQNGSQGLRVGVYDLADGANSPKWPTTDLSGNSVLGSGVKGYSLFQNCGPTFNSASPMDLRSRTNMASASLLGTTSDHKLLVTGPGNLGTFTGFTAGTAYTLQFTLFRTNSTDLIVAATWQNPAGGNNLTVSYYDTNAATFNFDTFGLRPSSAGTSATNLTINEVRVELTSGNVAPSISLDPLDTSVYTGQTAFFSIIADGTAPLAYQWYFNTNTAVAGGTNAALTLNNVQLTDGGRYFCVVSNSSGTATSAVAQLTVTVPVAPSLLSQPADQTIAPGGTTHFSVNAAGSTPLSYQWYFNTNTPVNGLNDATLTLANVQATNVGTYQVVVNNLAGSVTSNPARLLLDQTPTPPSLITVPASVVTTLGSTASFTVSAAGSAPILFQWFKNSTALTGATNTILTLTNVQNPDVAGYTVQASNNVGKVVSGVATLTISSGINLPPSAYNLTGFAYQTTGGGALPETDPAYRKVTNALDLATALVSAYKTAGSVKVIEITTNLDLGWNEIGSAVQTLTSTPFRAHNPPQLHPRLLVTGVSLIDIKPRSGLTIFSPNGATIRHACFNLKSTANVILRNLKFDELWEWDEASKGNYDKNDWDFIDLGNGGTVTNIWIDHCTFTKTYDGIVDIKGGSSGITISWCRYTGDDGATNTNSFVWQQIDALEASRSSYPFYNFLRNNGFSPTDIVTIIQGHDKTHLIGANSLDTQNANHTVTLHHEWFMNPWDRLPRLRAGNVHNYNLYADDVRGLAAKRLRDTRAAAMSTANQNTLNNTYSFNPFLNGSIATENGAILVEKSVYHDCLTPLRNNQTDPSNPVYTGKIMALDTIYQMDSTYFRGNSTDAGGSNTLGPVQAAIIPFSWNLPGGTLPYSYTPDDPAQLPDILAAGSGSGVVTWNKTNWLLTTYPATAPQISAQPQSQTAAPGGSVTFTVVASGSANLNYQWYFNTNTPLTGATSPLLTVNNVQATNAGTYSVIITNGVGQAVSQTATLSLSQSAPTPPQFGAVIVHNGHPTLTINGDAGLNYIIQTSSNLVTWQDWFTNQLATPPFDWTDTNSPDQPRQFYRVRLGP